MDAHRNAVAAAFLGAIADVPDLQTIAALEPAFAQLCARRQAIKAYEPVLARQLDQEIAEAIRSCREVSDSGGG